MRADHRLAGCLRSRVGSSLLLAAALALAGVVHSPSLRLELASDDYEYWRAARMSMIRPELLFTSGNFVRPTSNWLFALNDTVSGIRPWSYHATNLFLHLLSAVLFWMLLRRLNVGPPARAALVAIWVTSPYSLECAQWPCARHDPLMMIGWMGMALVWPGADESWTRKKIASFVGLLLLTLLSKETWVVLPGFAFCFDLALRRVAVRRALRSSAVLIMPVLAYVLLYLTLLPHANPGYLDGGVRAMLKVPHAWAAFCGITFFRVLAFPFAWPEAVALAMIAALTWFGWTRRQPLMLLGTAFFFLPFLPLLTIAWMTTRYTAIPLAGFLMMIAGVIQAAPVGISPRAGTWVRALAATAAALMLVVNLAWLHWDMDDARAYSAAHAALLAEAHRFELPDAATLVAVRLESTNAPQRLLRELRGVQKLYYPRHPDPYDLINWASLFTFVGTGKGGSIWDGAAPSDAPDYAVVGHVDGGFIRLRPEGSTVQEEVSIWRERGRRASVIRRWDGS